MVGGAELAQRGGAHQLEKSQTGFAVLFALEICIRLWQNLMSRIFYGTVAIYVGVNEPIQVCRIPPELFQIAVRFIAGKDRRHHKSSMAEQIILHVRLVDDFVFGTAENLSDQSRIGGCARQLPDGDFFQIDGNHPVRFPMPRRKRKGKQHVLLRQRRQCSWTHIVPHKNNVFRLILSQGIQSGIQLRIAQNHKDHIILCIRRKLCHHRNAADRHARREFVLDPQPILFDLCCPVSPGKQGHILSGAEQVPCQIASQNARTIYQNFHFLPPNLIFTICIFIIPSPTLARKRKKLLTDGSFKSL